MKKHGFARDSIWTSEKDLYESDEDAVTGIFKLTDSEDTLKQWNYHFELEYLVTLTANSLVTKLVYTNALWLSSCRIKNTDSSAFNCKALLHTYYALENVNDIEIKGMHFIMHWIH